MSNTIYPSLGRQQGLMQEMQVVANNLANSSTTGYKADRAIFTEFLVSPGPQEDSISMGGLGGHAFKLGQGDLKFTGSQFDLAVQGEGFFVLQTPQGPRLTRAGNFQLSSESTLIDAFGNSVLGAGGNPITIPEDAAQISIGGDGSISANGQLIDRVGVVKAEGELERDSNTFFAAPGGYAQFEEASVVQGALEQSNVSPVLEVARMIEVQRAYEAGQAMLDREDDRISQLITSMRER
ncbi:MAG: flagellar hook-basal body complex protein [Hyphomonas sp.]|uniref:flagellar hook-basal body complex protein n=1 Tax=Hyphomonas sp. TaxID=87 RepID=UPI00180CA937|nr:flagellar hook-basal body complex protein [Hyphomonas sp.]MBA3067876.1 flagellar hook-basal body complex protein [Hyphomonas sp.]MBU4062432.1 flagellar hook-basal body complex protein [Alphaproteobacteria bacterium]MBU4165959.1 flagellar hook-basal body complex protein [Alphaproteobacteria bacterium]